MTPIKLTRADNGIIMEYPSSLSDENGAEVVEPMYKVFEIDDEYAEDDDNLSQLKAYKHLIYELSDMLSIKWGKHTKYWLDIKISDKDGKEYD